MTARPKPTIGDYACYSDDWTRTNSDLVVCLPQQPPYAHEASDHVLVEVTPAGDLLAIWTCATKEDVSDNAVMYARSTSKYDHPDPAVDSHCIVWQKPIRAAKDRPVAALNRSTAAYVKPAAEKSPINPVMSP